MARFATPTQQTKINDPYTQQLFPFNSTDGNVYLSRQTNFLLQAVGNDVVVSGLEVQSITVTDQTTVEITVGPGLIIQDSTLITIPSSTTVTLDTSVYDSCFGKLVLYTDFQYIESVGLNPLSIKLSYVANDGTFIAPLNDPWDWHRNRIYLEIYIFDNSSGSLSIKAQTHPNFFYIGGRRYYRRGKANFVPADDSTATTGLTYYPLAHNQMNYNIFSQLYDSNQNQLTINNLFLPNLNTVDVSIQEYQPYANYYSLVINNPIDVEVYTVLDSEIDLVTHQVQVYHNLNQRYVLVQVYDDTYTLQRVKTYLTNANYITLDFSAMYEDLAAQYYILITYNNIYNFEKEFTTQERIPVNHSLNKKYINSQLVYIDNEYEVIDSNNTIVTLIDNNNLYIDTNNCIFTSGNYNLMVYQNTLDPIIFYTGQTQTQSNFTFVKIFQQSDLISTDLTVTHDLNTSSPIVTLYDPANNIILPDIVTIVDANNILLTFEMPQTLVGVYTVCVYSNSNTILTKHQADINPATFVLQVDLTGLGISNPVFQCYDNNHQMFYPDQIEKVSETIYDFDFTSLPDLSTFYIIIANALTNSYVVTFDQLDVPANLSLTIAHGLSSVYPIVQLYMDNQLIIPEKIHVVDLNNITIDFTYIDLTISHSFECIILAGLPKIGNVFRYQNAYYAEFLYADLQSDQLIVAHDLNFMYPIVQVYNDSDVLITPKYITANTANQLTLDFTGFRSWTNLYKVIIMSSPAAITLR